MATSRTTKNTKNTAPELSNADISAGVLALVEKVTTSEKDGKARILTATQETFTDNADTLSALGEYVTLHVAPLMTVAVNGENVAKMFAKDGALYVEDTESRG